MYLFLCVWCLVDKFIRTISNEQTEANPQTGIFQSALFFARCCRVGWRLASFRYVYSSLVKYCRWSSSLATFRVSSKLHSLCKQISRVYCVGVVAVCDMQMCKRGSKGPKETKKRHWIPVKGLISSYGSGEKQKAKLIKKWKEHI